MASDANVRHASQLCSSMADVFTFFYPCVCVCKGGGWVLPSNVFAVSKPITDSLDVAGKD